MVALLDIARRWLVNCRRRIHANHWNAGLFRDAAPRGKRHVHPRQGLRIGWILTAVPPCLLGALIFRWGVDIPFWDQWIFVPILDKWHQGDLGFADLWQQQAEHRIFFPRLVMLVLAQVTSWNIRLEMALIWLLSVLVFVLAIRWLKATSQNRRLTPLTLWTLSLLVFNLSQWESWAWGLQLVYFINVAAVTAGFLCLAMGADRWPQLLSAAALGFVASYSFSNGLLFWFLSLPMVMVSRQRRYARVGLWMLLTLGALVLFFWSYSLPPTDQSLHLAFADVPRIAAFVGVYLGAPIVAYDGKGAALVGLASVAVFLFFAALALRQSKELALPWMSLAGYGMGSGVLAALGRQSIELALSSRYITFSNLFWLGLAGLGLQLTVAVPQQQMTKWLPALRRLSLAGVALSLLASSFWGGALLERQFQERSMARKELLEGRLDEHDPWIFPRNELPKEWVDTLRRHRLSLFRDDG